MNNKLSAFKTFLADQDSRSFQCSSGPQYKASYGKAMILSNGFGIFYNLDRIIKIFNIKEGTAKDGNQEPISHIAWADGSWIEARFVPESLNRAIVIYYCNYHRDQIYFHLHNLNVL